MTRRFLTVVALVAALSVIVHASLPASDNFNRADENPLGGNWTAPDGVAGSKFLLSSNQLKGQGGATFQLMYWNADTFGANQKSQATLGGVNLTGAAWGGVAVRVQASGQSAYVFGLTNGGSSYLISKMASGALSSTLATCSATPTVSDILRLEVSGTTLTGYVNGASPSGCSGTDSTYSSGQAGLWGYASLDWYDLDNWSGDNLSAGGGCPKTFLLLGVGC